MGSVRGGKRARALAHACCARSHLVRADAHRLERLEQEQPEKGTIVALADLSQLSNKVVSVH